MTEDFMMLALEQAKLAFLKNEVPIGAVIVKEGKVIAFGHNTKVKDIDLTSHAEINVIKSAQKTLNSTYLDGCELYVTAEPCLMCTGAIIQSKISKVFYGAKESKFGAHISKYNILANNEYNHKIQVYDGLLEDKCKELLTLFFKEKR